MKKIKLKFKKKQIIIISSILLVIIAFAIIMITKTPNVGSIKNGKANYIDRIANVTKSEDNIGFYIISGILSIVGLAGAGIFYRRKQTN